MTEIRLDVSLKNLTYLLYPWYCMSTTVHKILIHGPTIIDWSSLPMGQMSEDAQEA